MAETTGLYSNLVVPGTTPVAGSAASGLDIGTMVQIRNKIWDSVLPDGRLKTALLSFDGSLPGIVEVWKTLLTNRKYSYGEYALGVALFEKVQCGGTLNNSDVPDDLVKTARLVFTMLLGVRIMNIVDLQRLEQGADAYYNNNPNRLDQPRNAVNRAVMIVQNMGSGCWNLPVINQYPLVAPVPDMTNQDDNLNRGKKYSGPGFGNQVFYNGYLKAGTSTGLTSGINAQSLSSTSINSATLMKYAPLIAILLVIGVIVSIKTGLYKPT